MRPYQAVVDRLRDNHYLLWESPGGAALVPAMVNNRRRTRRLCKRFWRPISPSRSDSRPKQASRYSSHWVEDRICFWIVDPLDADFPQARLWTQDEYLFAVPASDTSQECAASGPDRGQ